MAYRKWSPEERKEHRDADVKAAHARLEQGVADMVADGSAWKRYLDMQARMHNYSLNNVLLIMSQCPHASIVMGYGNKQGTSGWKREGRQVRKGEKAIKIFGHPVPYSRTETDPNTGEETTREGQYWPIVNVFDISQTDGPEYDEPPKPTLLEGDSEELRAAYARVERELNVRGIKVERVAPVLLSGANGDTDGKRVRVRDDVSDAQALKTLVHEYAHNALGHTDNLAEYHQHRGRMEVEADSVAYIVLACLDVDASMYSFAYVAGWANGDAKLVKETGEVVSKAARELCAKLDKA